MPWYLVRHLWYKRYPQQTVVLYFHESHWIPTNASCVWEAPYTMRGYCYNSYVVWVGCRKLKYMRFDFSPHLTRNQIWFLHFLKQPFSSNCYSWKTSSWPWLPLTRFWLMGAYSFMQFWPWGTCALRFSESLKSFDPNFPSRGTRQKCGRQKSWRLHHGRIKRKILCEEARLSF